MRFIRNIALFILVFYLTTLSVGVSLGREVATPGFSLYEYLTADRMTFDNILKTKANLLIVTETTCYSCIKELRAMELLKAKYRENISVSAAFVDRQGLDRIEKYLEFYRFDLDNLLIDPGGEIARNFNVTYIPTMMIFDRDGNEVYRKQGFTDGDESLFSAKIDEVLYPKSVKRARKTVPAPESAPRKTTGCASTPG